MYCSECGNKIEVGVKFCPNCGASTQASSTRPDTMAYSGEPIITAKPVFVGWVTMASVIPIQLFMTVWAGGFFGGFGMFGAQAIGLNLPSWFTFVFFGALAFFGIPTLVYFIKKKTYQKTEYKFYIDKLEYVEGFWTAENKVIKYKNITEANMRKGIIQKQYGLGTIILSTPATGSSNGRARSGIRIADIENTEAIYEEILKLLD